MDNLTTYEKNTIKIALKHYWSENGGDSVGEQLAREVIDGLLDRLNRS